MNLFLCGQEAGIIPEWCVHKRSSQNWWLMKWPTRKWDIIEPQSNWLKITSSCTWVFFHFWNGIVNLMGTFWNTWSQVMIPRCITLSQRKRIEFQWLGSIYRRKNSNFSSYEENDSKWFWGIKCCTTHGFHTAGTKFAIRQCKTAKRLREPVQPKTSKLLRKGVILLQNNATQHVGNETRVNPAIFYGYFTIFTALFWLGPFRLSFVWSSLKCHLFKKRFYADHTVVVAEM